MDSEQYGATTIIKSTEQDGNSDIFHMLKVEN